MKDQRKKQQAWEQFYASGSVGAYLMYRAILSELEKEEK